MAGMDRKHYSQSSVSLLHAVAIDRSSRRRRTQSAQERISLTIAKKYLVAPPISPSLVITAMVRHAAMKTKMAWKTCATTLHFWIYDCGIRISFVFVCIQILKALVCVEGGGKPGRVSVNRQLTQPCEYVNTGGFGASESALCDMQMPANNKQYEKRCRVVCARRRRNCQRMS